MNLLFILMALCACAFFSATFTYKFFKKNTVNKYDYENVSLEKNAIENRLIEERAAFNCVLQEEKQLVNQLRAELTEARDKAIGMEYEKKISEDLRTNNEALSAQLKSAIIKIATFEAEQVLLNEQRAAQVKQIQEMQENVKLQFENLSNKIFYEHSQTFKKESQNRLIELLSPLKSDIDNFKIKMEHSFGAQAKEQVSLKSEIERIVKITDQMTSTTTNLTNALKGDFRTQGNWGEVILERIL